MISEMQVIIYKNSFIDALRFTHSGGDVYEIR